MANCKDCIHVKVCREYVMGLAAARGVELDATEIEQVLVCDDCEHFKDRSRFVELPFGVGDSYFEIFATIDDETAAIFKFHIDRIVQLKNAYGEPTDIFYEDRKAGRIQNVLKPYCRRFRSREEAEQALKERKKDE